MPLDLHGFPKATYGMQLGLEAPSVLSLLPSSRLGPSRSL